MAYRNKTYVAFDGDTDIMYYYLMKAWKSNKNVDFNFYDAHDLNTAMDSSTEETIKRRLAERMSNAKIFILLVGQHTRYLYRFVRWEINLAIKKDVPIVVVNLNGTRTMDTGLCPPLLAKHLAVHVSFEKDIIEYALQHWGDSHRRYRSAGKTGVFYYSETIYNQLGV